VCRGVSGGDLGGERARARVKTGALRWGPVAGERGNSVVWENDKDV